MTDQEPDPSVDNAADAVGGPEPVVVSPEADKSDTLLETDQQGTEEVAAEEAPVENEERADADQAAAEPEAAQVPSEEATLGKRKLGALSDDADQPEVKKMNTEQVCAVA
jgi:hypothetical protein